MARSACSTIWRWIARSSCSKRMPYVQRPSNTCSIHTISATRLDVVGGLVDVELDLEAVAHSHAWDVMMRAPSAARSIVPARKPAAAAGRPAPGQDVHRDAHGGPALGGPAILGEDPAHDPLLDVAVEAVELDGEHPARARLLDANDRGVDEDQERRPLEADLEPELPR